MDVDSRIVPGVKVAASVREKCARRVRLSKAQVSGEEVRMGVCSQDPLAWSVGIVEFCSKNVDRLRILSLALKGGTSSDGYLCRNCDLWCTGSARLELSTCLLPAFVCRGSLTDVEPALGALGQESRHANSAEDAGAMKRQP